MPPNTKSQSLESVSAELSQFIKYQDMANVRNDEASKRQDAKMDKLTDSVTNLVTVVAQAEAKHEQVAALAHKVDIIEADMKTLTNAVTINTVSSKDIRQLKFILITAFATAIIGTMVLGAVALMKPPPVADPALIKIIQLLEKTSNK